MGVHTNGKRKSTAMQVSKLKNNLTRKVSKPFHSDVYFDNNLINSTLVRNYLER